MKNALSEGAILFFIAFSLVGCETSQEIQAEDKKGHGASAPALMSFTDPQTGERLTPDAQDLAEHQALTDGVDSELYGESSPENPKLVQENPTNPLIDGVIHDPHGALSNPLVVHQDPSGKRAIGHGMGNHSAVSEE